MVNGSPQLEDGHTRLANELLDEIIRHDFSKREYKIIFFVIRKTYGWNKKADCMSLSQIVAGTGLTRGHCCDSVNSLCSYKVLLKWEQLNGQILELNKHYNQWEVLPKREHVPKTGTEVLPKRELSVTKTGTTKDTIQKTIKNNISENGYSLDFETFWKLYPNKTGKGAAWTSWNKQHISNGTREKIAFALEWQVKSEKWRSGYIPNPSTYLNQRRWEDEPTTKHENPWNGAI